VTERSPDKELNPLRKAGVQPTAESLVVSSTELQSPWRGDWGYFNVGRAAETNRPVARERVFSRKVLLGWAFITLAAYFSVRAVGPALLGSVRESVASHAPRGRKHSPGHLVIMLPNGKRIVIDNPVSPATPTPDKSRALHTPTGLNSVAVPKASAASPTSDDPAKPSKK
jgi:hypothetical protein